MTVAPTESAAPTPHAGPGRHESFLLYRRFRYLKIAIALSVASIVIYIVDRPYGTRYGGSWAGYTLGTIGALLILWLMWFGYRKRSYTADQGNLAAWLSAHVYFGLALVIVATLHTGFHFGWNIHTLAYALMCVVIASGAFGVYCYVRYPRMMTENRRNLTMPQMLGRIATLNEELRNAAIVLDDRSATLVERSIEQTDIGGSLRRQLSGSYPDCATTAALAGIGEFAAGATPELETLRRVRVMLEEKSLLLARTRRDISYKAMMEVWLYIHVPLSFALLAALVAHVVAVFFLW